jgi:hypothetical protein
MIALAAAVLIALVGGGAAAQTVALRSGDHDGYARLVLEFPGERPGWRLTRAGEGYALIFDAEELEIDASEVFRLIGRDRISSVTQSGPGEPLMIGIACDCHAEAFDFRTGAVVIDVRDGSPPVGSPFEGATGEAQAAGRMNESPPGLSLLAGGTVEASAVLPFQWENATDPAIGSRVPPNMSGATEGSGTDSDGPSPVPANRDRATIEAIAGELGRASSQGLIDLPLTLSPTADPESPAGQGPRKTSAPGAANNLRVMTGIDRDFGALGPDRPQRASEPRCLPDSAVSVARWGDEARLGEEIARYRAAAVDARDAPDPTAVRALARHYVFLTFGAESRLAVESLPERLPDADLLRTLADVMDGEQPTAANPLAGQSDCTSEVALWALLASPEPSLEVPATATIMTTFSGLPVHLRRHLAPRLAAALDGAGQPDAAVSVLNAATRAGGDAGASVALAAALRENDTTLAENNLRSLRASNPLEASQAVLALLERDLATGGPIDAAILEDAAAFAFELRDDPVGQALAKARIRGLAVNGAFIDALAALRQLSGPVVAETEPATHWGLLLGTAAARADDGEFLTVSFALAREGLAAEVPADARRAAAARLIGLGLDDMASLYLTPGDEGDPGVRLARANRALTTGNAAAALAQADGLEIVGGDLIEAEALSASGAHGAAADAFAQLGDQLRSEAESLRARDWKQVLPSASRDAGQLLGEAEMLRRNLGALLERHQP